MSRESQEWGWQSHGQCWGAGGSREGQAPLPWELPALELCTRRIFHSQLQGMFCSMDNCSSFLLFVGPVKR